MYAALLCAMVSIQSPGVDAQATPPFPVASTNPQGGRVFRITMGQNFDSLAPFLRPGDEVVLEQGIHPPITLTDVRGERMKPVVICGEPSDDPSKPVFIQPAEFGIRLVRPHNVVVRNLMVGNASVASISIEGEANLPANAAPWDSNVRLASLQITQTMKLEKQVSVRLRNVSRVDCFDLSIQGWNQSAVVLDHVNQISLNASMFDTRKELPQTTGIVIGRNCNRVSIGVNTFGLRVGTAFDIGSCATGEPSLPPASRILVSRNNIPEAESFARIGSVDQLFFEANTVTDPRRNIYSVQDGCGEVERITFTRNIFSWIPGSIEHLCDTPESLPASAVQLNANLWWSAEIPAAFEAIGEPFGMQSQPQVLDVDPRIEPRFAEPLEPKAQEFGWRIGSKTASAEAAKDGTPVEPAAPSRNDPAPPPPKEPAWMPK